MRRAGVLHHQSFLQALAMPWPVFCDYLEARFEWSWDWSNYGTVHEIDHVIPFSAWNLQDPVERAACGHWRNLRPMSKSLNRSKNGRYDEAQKAKYLAEVRAWLARRKRG